MFTTKGLDILNTRTSVSSISENNKFTLKEIERFLLYLQYIKESLIYGYERYLLWSVY